MPTLQIQIEVNRVQQPDGFNVLVAYPQPPEVKGCPMGRGKGRNQAIHDLVRRIKIESHINVEIANPKIEVNEIRDIFFSDQFDNDIHDKIEYIQMVGTEEDYSNEQLLAMYDEQEYYAS